MRVELLRQLSNVDRERWRHVLRRTPALRHPFLGPSFFDAVAAVRPDAEVAALRCDDEVGFFPFQRRNPRHAIPLGGPVSNGQAVIAAAGVTIDPNALLRACELTSWRFQQLVGETAFTEHSWSRCQSSWLDLSRGFEAWEADGRRRSRHWFRENGRKLRKLTREIGPLNLVLDSPSEGLFSRMLELKSEHYRRTGLPDVIAEDWVVRLLRSLRTVREEDCSGLFSVLYAGSAPVGYSYGLHAYGRFHGWFTTFEPAFARYSPGVQTFFEQARSLAERGFTALVLGAGPEDYKRRLGSHTTPVGCGCLDLRPITGRLRRGAHTFLDQLRRSPLRTPAIAPARWVKRTFGVEN